MQGFWYSSLCIQGYNVAKGSGVAQSYVADTMATLNRHYACVHQQNNDDGNPCVRNSTHINPQWKKKKKTQERKQPLNVSPLTRQMTAFLYYPDNNGA